MKIDAVALINILKSEKEIYQGMLDLALEEQELIVERDVAGLSDVVKKTEQLMSHLHDLEQSRQTLLRQNTNRAKPQPSSELSTIIKDFDPAAAGEALTLRDDILAIAGKLNEANHINAELLKRNVSYIDFLMSTLAQDDNPIYCAKSTTTQPQPRLFDGIA